MIKYGKLLADFHTHTTASIHAYSSLRENIDAAKRKGLKYLATTDHASGAPDSPPLSFFDNLLSLPEEVEGLRLLRGAEANIMDHTGRLDLPEKLLAKLDLVIASYHGTCVKPSSLEEHTNAYLALCDNPHVDIIGHSGSAAYPYDYERVIPAFGQAGKLIEINAHTFICRKDSVPNCIRIAQLCAKHGLAIVVNSDAHSEFELAECEAAFQMLAELNFPEELILNLSSDRIEAFIKKLKKH